MTDSLESKMDGVADIWSALNCIKIISNVDKFKNWLKKEHKLDDLNGTFEGYRFFLESAIRTFLNDIIYNSSLDIWEDFVFYRARFVGVELNKISNTCEKTILIKNINKKLRLIKKAKNYEEIKSAIDQLKNNVLDVFDKIYENNVAISPRLNISKDEALEYTSMNTILIFLNDVSKSIPKGYWVSVLDNKINPKQLKRNFKGYKYSLQFVWFSLLGEKYCLSSVKNLHKTNDWCIKEDFLGLKQKQEEIKNGEDLDSYFEIINKEVITPLEKKLKINLGSPNPLYLKENISSDTFKDLLKSSEEPQLNEKEKLDYTLLWYQIELLDSSKNHIFNGVPAFISLLAGTAELKRKFAGGEKAYICKFVHHNKSVNGNDFSYGVLIEAFGSTGISDYSGWILFFDCCGDYSGFAGSEHVMAEMVIDEYKKRDLIEVREMVIDRDKLKEYIADKITTEEKREEIIDILSKKTEIRKEKAIVNEARGLVLELITYYTFSRKTYNEVDWNVTRDGEQLDVTLETTDDFTLIECKRDPNNMNLDNEIKNLKNKLNNYHTDKNKNCEFWFWIRPTPTTDKKLKKAKINYEVLPNVIWKNSIWKNKKRDKIKTILDKEKPSEERYAN